MFDIPKATIHEDAHGCRLDEGMEITNWTTSTTKTGGKLHIGEPGGRPRVARVPAHDFVSCYRYSGQAPRLYMAEVYLLSAKGQVSDNNVDSAQKHET